MDDSGTLITQQRYLPFGGQRQLANYQTSGLTDYTYTGQRTLNPGMGGLMDYKARFYSPVLGRFIQPDTLIPNPANPQVFNRFSYVANRPVNFNDPTGHEPKNGCYSSISGICTYANGKIVPIVNEAASSAYQFRAQGEEPLENHEEESKPKDFEPLPEKEIQPLINYSELFDPFAKDERVIHCRLNECNITIYDVPGYYAIDWSRVDKTNLALDIFGLGLSVVGLAPVSKALKINSNLEKGGLVTFNFLSNTASASRAVKQDDDVSLFLTGAGILYPPLSITTAAIQVLNDLSDAVYFVPTQE